MKFDEKKKKKFKSPLFCISMATVAKFVLPIPFFFLAYLVSLDVDVTGNITAKIVGVWSEFNIFCTLVTMATAAILNFCNPPKGIQKSFKFPLFGFHGSCGKICPNDSDFFGLFTWMLLLSSFINFCLASNPLRSFLCFSFFSAFWPFPWQRHHFGKINP